MTASCRLQAKITFSWFGKQLEQGGIGDWVRQLISHVKLIQEADATSACSCSGRSTSWDEKGQSIHAP
jgi:hypothetical protein